MTAESPTWNIERVWSATTEAKTEELSTLELSRFHGLIMLGAAGAGKTTEAARLADQERIAGATVHSCRLAEFAESSTELRQHLAKRSRGANERTVLYLDALDEAMIPARRCWLAVKRWVTGGSWQGTGASIRITCRSAVWPSELTQVIREFTANQPFATAATPCLSATTTSTGRGRVTRDRARLHSSNEIRSLRCSQPCRATSFPSNADTAASIQPRTACLSEGPLRQNGLQLLASDPRRTAARSTRRIPCRRTELLEAAERLGVLHDPHRGQGNGAPR